MRFVKSFFVVAAAILVTAAAREARAQQADPFVSCVKCHALPMQQALAEMEGHGYGYPPAPEQACAYCHDTVMHEQDPSAPAYPRYFLWPDPTFSGPNSYLTNHCTTTSCHPGLHGHKYGELGDPLLEAMPYGSPSALVPGIPTSVLPLFDPFGMANQNPDVGGMVCSTCHDPHEPAFTYNGSPKFLRIGSSTSINQLCNPCHDPNPPLGAAPDLELPSRSNSVSFETMPAGDQRIDVTVKNRGNAYYPGGSAQVSWINGMGYSMTIGSLTIPSLPPDQETTIPFIWTPMSDWAGGEGFYVFSLPPSDLLPAAPKVFVRAMDVTPAPTNLRVTGVGPGEISLSWDLPSNRPTDLAWDVYRDGVKITSLPWYQPMYVDAALAPETPHVYTVVAVSLTGGLPSQPSDPAGGTTAVGTVIRVPEDYPTIQQAIDAAWSGTSIHVAPGAYTERLNLADKYAITVKGQDANGCILDYTGTGTAGIPVDLGSGQPGNTLAGFTVRNGLINMDAGDVVSGCVLVADGQPAAPAVVGGGLVAQCVFDAPNLEAVYIPPDKFLTSVNSIYLGSQPFNGYAPPAETVLLLNNDFPNWYGWTECDGSGNFSDSPAFASPGPPTEYFPAASPTFDAGLPLGAPYLGTAPDVGAFEFGQAYTPQPPTNLAATFVATPFRHIELSWTGSVDDPARMWEYRIYRSTDPEFPPASEAQPYATVTAGTTAFNDYDVESGITYYYQVRAYAGPAYPLATHELLSAPTNTASAEDVNTPPVTVDDVAATDEGLPVTVAVLANDSDPDGDVFHILEVGYPQFGSAMLNADETIEYTPAPGFFGTDSFTYTLLDVRGGSATALVTVTVNPVNHPPVAVDDAFSIQEDLMLSFAPGGGVLVNDTDPDGDALQSFLVTGPAHGTLTLNTDGSFTYFPEPDFHGTDSFSYHAVDEQSAFDEATVTITVVPVNDPPRAANDTYATAEDLVLSVPAAQGVLANDSEVDGDPFGAMVVSPPQHGTLEYLFFDGAFRYRPAANFNGTDSFAYRLNAGTLYSSPATVTITVSAVNDAPGAAVQPVSTAEDTAVAVTLAATDADGDALTFTVASTPTHGTLTGAAPNLTYVPDVNYYGADSFTFTASDGQATSATATVSITVLPENDLPLANDDTAATAAHVPVLIAVLGNDTDPDGDTLSVSSATPGANGSAAVQAGGSILYTPNPGFTGTDGFSYVVDDGSGGTDTASVTVSVRPQKLRITALTMATVTSSRYTNAKATPLAVDEAGAPVAGVSVGGRWSGLTTDADTSLTGVDGKMTVSSNQVRNANGTFTFTINTATKAGYELDRPASVMTNAIQYPAPPPPAGKMHVASIVMGLKSGSKGTNATSTVTVVDANGVPVASAAVSGSWSGAVTGTGTGTTGTDGRVTLSSVAIKNAASKTFTFAVTGIAKSGWTYDSAANVEKSDSITAP